MLVFWHSLQPFRSVVLSFFYSIILSFFFSCVLSVFRSFIHKVFHAFAPSVSILLRFWSFKLFLSSFVPPFFHFFVLPFFRDSIFSFFRSFVHLFVRSSSPSCFRSFGLQFFRSFVLLFLRSVVRLLIFEVAGYYWLEFEGALRFSPALGPSIFFFGFWGAAGFCGCWYSEFFRSGRITPPRCNLVFRGPFFFFVDLGALIGANFRGRRSISPP